MRAHRIVPWLALLALAPAAAGAGVLGAPGGATLGAWPGPGVESRKPARPPLASELALPAITTAEGGGARSRGADDGGGGGHLGNVLNARRARILLRSLTIPGWGQAELGDKRGATVFAVAEVGVWASFLSFRIQEQLRRDAYERTALLFAGINLSGRDEEFRRIVGAYVSSDEYNRLVVYRDAANIYLSDPGHEDPQGYRDYIAQHSLKGADSWDWQSDDALHRYGAQRKDAQRAQLRANTALALAVANRLLSAIHAARLSGRVDRESSWHFEVAPVPGPDPTAFQLGVTRRF